MVKNVKHVMGNCQANKKSIAALLARLSAPESDKPNLVLKEFVYYAQAFFWFWKLHIIKTYFVQESVKTNIKKKNISWKEILLGNESFRQKKKSIGQV